MKRIPILLAALAWPLAAQQTKPLTREIKIVSSAGARALADACSVWAEQHNQTVAIAILDWGGNLVESHAMEGAPMNAIDTALLKAKSGGTWPRSMRAGRAQDRMLATLRSATVKCSPSR